MLRKLFSETGGDFFKKSISLSRFCKFLITLAAKLETTLKPAKPPINHPNQPQTTQKPVKYWTNHQQTSQL